MGRTMERSRREQRKRAYGVSCVVSGPAICPIKHATQEGGEALELE